MVVFSLWNFNAVLSIASVKVFPEKKKKGKKQKKRVK